MTPTASDPRRRWMILAVLGTAQLMVVLDATVVNIALPSAQRTLHFANDNRQWIITAYALAFGSLLLPGGRLSDWFGRKWTLIAGLTGFALASAVGGASHSFAMLVAARAVQGTFAALLAPAALSLLTTTFTEPRERARAFGIFAAIAGSGASIGLLLGGVLTQTLSWRYCMYVNLVFACGAVAGAAALLDSSRPPARPALDVPGTLTVSGGLFALVYGFAHAQSTSWGNGVTVGTLAAGVLLLGVFVGLERHSASPLLPPRVIAVRNRGASFLSIAISTAAIFAVILFLTYYLQQTHGYSPITTGVAFLPMTAMIMGSAVLGLTKLQGRLGPRPLVAAGMTLGAAGMLYLTRIGASSSYAGGILPALVVAGVGLGLVISTSISNATLGVQASDAGMASATVSASQQVGGSLGVAALSTIAANAAVHYLAAHHAAGRAPGLLARAAVHGYAAGFAWSAGLFAASALLCGALFTRATDAGGAGERHARPRHRVVVVGGGFGGLQAALRLARAPVDVTLIDRRNFHLFQPLVYQVATGALAPAEITYPLRRIFRGRRNVRVLLAEVTDIRLDERTVCLRAGAGEHAQGAVRYDTLVVSGGSRYNYFGHDRWRAHAENLKTLEGAVAIRRRILEAFEAAELEHDPQRRAAWLTFMVVGAGPTGVEIAGQIAEIARDLPREVDLDATSVTLEDRGGERTRIATRTVTWAAGVIASPLAALLSERAGLQVDRAGRVEVQPDLSLAGHPEVLAIGDMIRIRRAAGSSVALPGLAPVAMQEGRHAARVVRERLRGRRAGAFRYRDKGNLATIGRASAVAEVGGIRLSGFAAWAVWLTVHLWFLIGFQNRLLVVIRWSFSFITHGRGARLIAPAAEPGRDDAGPVTVYAAGG